MGYGTSMGDVAFSEGDYSTQAGDQSNNSHMESDRVTCCWFLCGVRRSLLLICLSECMNWLGLAAVRLACVCLLSASMPKGANPTTVLFHGKSSLRAGKREFPTKVI